MQKNPDLHREENLTASQKEYVKTFPYAEIVGALLYLTSLTRPDIAYSVGTLTRYMSKPTHAACHAVSRVLNYLGKYPELGLKYNDRAEEFHVYTDSDWAADLLTRRSVSGMVACMAGGLVSWSSKLQPIVSTSSMEAEYIAAYFAACLVVWVRALLGELDLLEVTTPTTVYIDNTSARSLANNPVFHARSKHIDVKFHWLREKVQDKSIVLVYCPTDDNTSDIMTKPLTGEVFHRHMVVIVVERVASPRI
jgi:hypothetical protein